MEAVGVGGVQKEKKKKHGTDPHFTMLVFLLPHESCGRATTQR